MSDRRARRDVAVDAHGDEIAITIFTRRGLRIATALLKAWRKAIAPRRLGRPSTITPALERAAIERVGNEDDIGAIADELNVDESSYRKYRRRRDAGQE